MNPYHHLPSHCLKPAFSVLLSVAFLCAGCASANRTTGSTGDAEAGLRTPDTVLLRDIRIPPIDSLYVMFPDTGAYLISMRIFSPDTLRFSGETFAFERREGADPGQRPFALYRAMDAAAYARFRPGHVDMEIVVQGNAAGMLELNINDAPAFGGPEMTGVQEPRGGERLQCGGRFPVNVGSGCSLRTQIFPERPRGAPAVRTTNVRSVARDTTFLVEWNCLRDDGTPAAPGTYRLQSTSGCSAGTNVRIRVWTVRVR